MELKDRLVRWILATDLEEQGKAHRKRHQRAVARVEAVEDKILDFLCFWDTKATDRMVQREMQKLRGK